jgi:PAS domain S-box-containing protein
MHGSHESPLVALSILIAICASYTALTLAGRVAVARGTARVAWLLGGCVAMGSGIWSMHFVAMLAFHLPVPISYDVPPVALSHFAAVAASAFALFVASRSKVGTVRLCAAGFCLGLAIVAMHYMGMAAVRVQARLSYDPTLVAASVVIAVGASTVALWLFLWLRNDNTRRGRIFRACAAVVMGLAISGMHYTAMAAARFTEIGSYQPAASSYLVGSAGLAVPVVLGAFVILALTLLGSVTDHWVRAKLAAAEALRESEERYRSVLGDIDEVIFRTDAAGRLTFLNPAWTQITGWTPAESLGTLLLDAVHHDDHELAAGQSQLLLGGQIDYCRHEARYHTTAGGWRWVEVHARATRGALGDLSGTTGVIRDVTERRRAEEALRTAREAAETASRAKSEFLSRMSHELRTPLNAILGFGQLMELEASTAEQREYTDHIMKAGTHLLHLVNEVLDMTGIEAGGLRLSSEPMSVVESVQVIFDIVHPLASIGGITLAMDDSTRGRFVHADRQRLNQVLLNIVANAVKYNRPGGRVVVSCEDCDDERMRIVVADTGCGIAPEKVPRLFTPFDRLGAEQTGIEGTGLGLALSKRLAEAMDGEIGMRTPTGPGCVFWVELPRAINPLSRLDVSGLAAAVASKKTSLPERRYTILYVEDNLSNLTLVQRILDQRNDIDLVQAMQGALALQLVRSRRPDLVLLDLHLPDIPGEEVLRQLRNAPESRDIPVVILSADATPGQADRLLAAGANAFITKPLEVKSFIEVLEDVLEGSVATR